MTSLSERQQRFIQDHYRQMSIKKMAKQLKVEKKLVVVYIRELTAKQPGSRRALFTVLILLIPLIFLLVVEVVLRAFNYGDELKLVLTRESQGQKYYEINKQVGRRYFSHLDLSIPSARDAVFEYQKSPETYRIFCLGGSTTAGFPFEFNATFPSLLNDRLSTLFPEKHFEVINVGISAVNSYTVLDFTHELVHYEPDLFLIYMGHNEFYGALGVGSTQSLGSSRTLVKLYLCLQQSSVFNLLRNIIFSARKIFSSKSNTLPDRTLMERMVREKSIPLESKEYSIAKNYFEKNLTEIINVAKRNGADVLVSNLVSNLKAQMPFNSIFAEDTPNAERERWKKLVAEARRYEQSGKFQDAIEKLKLASDIDDSPAVLHFLLGQALEGMGDYKGAGAAYLQAKDLDGLRFRAPIEFNKIIANICAKQNVPLVDMAEFFAQKSRRGIIGGELIIEHLHPNFEGYFQMAQAFCLAMAENNMVAPGEEWHWQLDKTDAEYRRMAGVTDFDLEIASQRIKKLTSRWPFQRQIIMRDYANTEFDKFIEKTAMAYLRRKVGWNEAHYRIARYFTQRKMYDRAAREYESVIKVTPNNYFPYLQLGDMLLGQEKFSEAEKNYKKALSLSPQLPYGYAKLGMLYTLQDLFDKAVPFLESALNANNRVKVFNKANQAQARYMLAVGYANQGKLEAAVQEAETALKLTPGDIKIKQLLKQITSETQKRKGS